MKLIKTLDEKYINIKYIKYIYTMPVGQDIHYYVFIEDKFRFEVSKNVYNSLINKYRDLAEL